VIAPVAEVRSEPCHRPRSLLDRPAPPVPLGGARLGDSRLDLIGRLERKPRQNIAGRGIDRFHLVVAGRRTPFHDLAGRRVRRHDSCSLIQSTTGRGRRDSIQT
jgi:hypothetical protein